jgi:5-formyltetrahydrofolate cyclo-ligase
VSDELPPNTTLEEYEALKRLAKEELRKRAAALRRALPSEVRAARAARMCERLMELEAFRDARTIATYMPLRFEIAPTIATERAFALGKVVVLPRVDNSTKTVTLHRYEAEDPLEESSFMVREPLASAAIVPLQDVDVVLVPGLAFDAHGQRLGFGQGFYDRLLLHMRALRIGLCFDFQLLAEVPSFPHDLPVDCVVTDLRVLRSNC